MKRFNLNRRRFLTLSGTGSLLLLSGHSEISFGQIRMEGKTSFTAKDYSRLLGMDGFSDTLLKNHFALYQSYVMQTNRLIDTLNQRLREGKSGSPEYAELKRRLGWEFNGMRLHEYYFENLGGKEKIDNTGKLMKRISDHFGGYEVWEKDFKATAMMRGIGWAILYQDPNSGKFFNFWVTEHEGGNPAGCIPILILDAFEHAFIIDYGLKRGDYVEAFFKNVAWKVVEGRMI